MTFAVLHRGFIAKQALTAARRFLESGQRPPNPYCAHMEPEANAAWEASYARYLEELTAPEGAEGGA